VPRLDLLGGVMVSRSGANDGVGYSVAIAGELPVFDRGQAAADRARADAKRWQAEIAALTNDARSETAQAARELTLRIEQAEAYARGPMTRASDLHRRAAAAFREGDRPILELLDVQRSARNVAMRSLELVYEARRAEIALRRASGSTR
jgi:outer membrane protein TolC